MAHNKEAHLAWLKLRTPPHARVGIADLYKAGAWEVLSRNYGGSDRLFHGWDHILDLLAKNEQFRGLAKRPDLIAHAIVWHDIIQEKYNANGSARSDADNVNDSAELFLRFANMPELDKHAIYGMIMASANHRNLPPSAEFYRGYFKDREMFVDLDLSTLAAERRRFAMDSCHIRKEAPHIPARTFYWKRAAKHMAASRMKPFYYTPSLEEKWGRRARLNMMRSTIVCAFRGLFA